MPPDEDRRRPPGNRAGRCEHAPVPGTCRTYGEDRGICRADLADAADYPVIAKCRHCRRLVRCDAIGKPWQAEEEYAGVDIAPFRQPFDSDPDEDGMFRIVPRIGEQVSGGYCIREEV